MALSLVLGLAEVWLLRAIATDVARYRQRQRARIERRDRAIARRLQNTGALGAVKTDWKKAEQPAAQSEIPRVA